LAGYEPAESSGAPDPSVTGQPASYEPAESGDDIVPFGYLSPGPWPDDEVIWQRIRALEKETATHPSGPLTVPEEPLPLVDARGAFFVKLYGFEKWGQLFTPRQLLSLLTFAKYVRAAQTEMLRQTYDEDRAKVIATYVGLLSSRTADWNSGMTHWTSQGEKLGPTFTRMALPMVWDFVEINPLVKVSGNAVEALERIVEVIQSFVATSNVIGQVFRDSATSLPFENNTLDAVITDPPYYDNVPYSDLSDFFYVWLKRSIGFLYPEHFSSLLTPKKKEAIMDAGRHNRNKETAKEFYEQMMAQAFSEANRVLKPGAPLVIVYAHKTTLGWATLVDALRVASFTVTEAWPLDTERPGRPRANDSAALASSIFLVARCRESNATGSYEQEVQPELQRIVRERLERLWAQGVTGADLVIACVGAGLRAFTRFARVEYANGEPVPADSFLTEVEGAVLEVLLEKIFGVSQAGLSRVDAVTRFYVLWRYAYRQATLDAGETIVFAYPQHVELDGPHGLSSGSNPLVEKQSGKYRLRDFSERGEDEELGLPPSSTLPPLRGEPEGGRREVRRESKAPLIDVLHRLLWLVENRPSLIPAYLDEARPDLERLRVVAQTLAGQTLSGNGGGAGARSLTASKGAEAAALRKLTTNWRSLIESHRGALV
jgi:putative DNA methylase